MRPEKDVRLLWSKLTLRRLLNSSGGQRSTVLRKEKTKTFNQCHFTLWICCHRKPITESSRTPGWGSWRQRSRCGPASPQPCRGLISPQTCLLHFHTHSPPGNDRTKKPNSDQGRSVSRVWNGLLARVRTHHCDAIQGFQGGQVEDDISTIAVQLLCQRVPIQAQDDEVSQPLFTERKKSCACDQLAEWTLIYIIFEKKN